MDKRFQFTLKNKELIQVLTDLPKADRGKLISMALAAYAESEDGKKIIAMFAGNKNQVSEQTVKKHPLGDKGKQQTQSLTVMGDFGE